MQPCGSCGHVNPVGARFCDNCGGTIAGQQVVVGHAEQGERRITIGRNPDQDLQVERNNMQVARRQAILYVQGNQVYIEDAGSSNGTHVNGTRITGRVPFQLTDKLQFGSYVFNTSRLQPLLGGAGQGGHVAYHGGGGHGQGAVVLTPGGQPRGGGPRTFLDGAFSEEGSWMPRLLVIYGVIAIVLFFLPIYVDNSETVGAMQLLGKKGVSGWVKLMMAAFPLIGTLFIILKVVRPQMTLVGALLLLAVIPSVGFLDGVDQMIPRKFVSTVAWRMGFFWLCTAGTVYGLMFFGSRPRDPLAKVLLGIFAGMLALSYFLPVSYGHNQSTIWIMFVIKALEHVEGLVVLVILSIVPLFLAVGSLWFLTPGAGGSRRRSFAQNMALTLGLCPSFIFFSGLFTAAIMEEKGGLVMTAVWSALYFSFVFLVPAFGATLVTLGVRKRGMY